MDNHGACKAVMFLAVARSNLSGGASGSWLATAAQEANAGAGTLMFRCWLRVRSSSD